MLQQTMTPLVVDISHHQEGEIDFQALYDSGVRGVIHKATQGSEYVDPYYAVREPKAKAVGLLWGAYHFADASDPTRQLNNFLNAVGRIRGNDVIVLDFEPNDTKVRKNTMSLAQGRVWLQGAYQRTGQRPKIYSGNLLKELLKKADPFFSAHGLWIAQYGPRPKLPPGFASYWLWQYSGDGINGDGIVPGINGKGIDCNVFGGEDLAAEWTHWPDRAAPQMVPGREDATVADLKGQSRKVDMLVVTKQVGAGIAAVSTAAGVANDVADTIAPKDGLISVPVPAPDAITVDNLDKLHSGVVHAKAIVETVKDIARDLDPVWHGMSMLFMHGWIGGTIAGVAAFILADKLLGWHLEDYIWGRWTPSNAPEDA